MANVFVKIGGKVLDVLKYPFVHAAKTAHILAATGEDLPEVKDLIVGLVEAGEKVGIDAVLAVGEKGLSIPDDLNAIKDAQAFFAYFKSTFLPGVEKIYDDITTASGEADTLQPAIEAAAAPAAAHIEAKLSPA